MKQSFMTGRIAMPTVTTLQFVKRIQVWAILLCLASTSFAQDTLTLQMGDLTLVTSSSMLQSGEEAVFEIHLGSSGDPLDGLLAVDLNIPLSQDAQIPNEVGEDYEYSWLADDENYSNSSSADQANSTLHLYCERTDQIPRSGHGEMVRFTLVSGANNVHPADLILDNISGQVIIDNLEMKRNEEMDELVPAGSIQIYPQPAREMIYLDPGTVECEEISIVDLIGNVRMTLQESGDGPFQIPVDQLGPGAWIMALRTINGEVIHKMFVTSP